MANKILKTRRPAEVEIEMVIIAADLENKGHESPGEIVLENIALRNLRKREANITRQEHFNRKNGWKNNPFQKLLSK